MEKYCVTNKINSCKYKTVAPITLLTNNINIKNEKISSDFLAFLRNQYNAYINHNMIGSSTEITSRSQSNHIIHFKRHNVMKFICG